MKAIWKALISAGIELALTVKDALADGAISIDEAKDILAKLKAIIASLKGK